MRAMTAGRSARSVVARIPGARRAAYGARVLLGRIVASRAWRTVFRRRIIEQQFRDALGYELNLRHPATFNAKIQWLKLFYRDPLMTVAADKYRAREFVANTVGERYLTPLLGVWTDPAAIDFDALPERFVLKVNNGSGTNIICRDKSSLDRDAAAAQLRGWMRESGNWYRHTFEWAYKDIRPTVIAEEYLEAIDDDLWDYKLWCFDGEPQFVQVVSGRFTDLRADFFDLTWNRLGLEWGHAASTREFDRPAHLDEMRDIARQLAAPFPFARVDLYDLPDGIRFGEVTFYPGNGFWWLRPPGWDERLGELVQLPERPTGGRVRVRRPEGPPRRYEPSI